MAVRASGQITLVVTATPSYVRSYYLLQNSTLSAPAKPTTNPPAAPWTTQEPTYVAGSTVTLYRVELNAWSDGYFEYGPVQLDSKYEAAKGAYNAAAAAQGTANTALTTADGKNTIVRSVNVAGGASAYRAGDQWWQFSGTNIIATWIHDGSLWINYKMNHTILGSVDAGSITTGFLNAAILAARSVTIDKLLVTSMDNLVQDPGFEANTAVAWNLTAPTTNGTTNPRTGLRALAMGTQGTAYVGAMTAPAARVEEGEQYRIGMWIRAGAGNTAANPIAIRFNTGVTEASTPTVNPDLQLGWSDGETSYANVGTVYGRVSGIWTVPAGVKFARMAIVMRDTTSGRTYYIDDIEMVKMAQGRLIVDGAIDGKLITGATIRTAASGARLQLDSFGLRAFDSTGAESAALYSDNGSMELGGITPSLNFRRAGQTYTMTTISGGMDADGGTFNTTAISNTGWRGFGNMTHRVYKGGDNIHMSEMTLSAGPANGDPGGTVYFSLTASGSAAPVYQDLKTLDRTILWLGASTSDPGYSMRNGALFGCNVATLGSLESKAGAMLRDTTNTTYSATGNNDLTVGQPYDNTTIKGSQIQARTTGGTPSTMDLNPNGGPVRVNGNVVDALDTGWINLPLRSGYVAHNGRTPQIRRKNGVTYMRGGFTTTSGTFTTATYQYAADLPSGFTAPTQNAYFVAFLGTQGTTGVVSVEGTTVRLTPSQANIQYIYLNNVVYIEG